MDENYKDAIVDEDGVDDLVDLVLSCEGEEANEVLSADI